jgi:hypothetical protein
MRTSTTTDNGWLSTERRVGWAIGTTRTGYSYPPGITPGSTSSLPHARAPMSSTAVDRLCVHEPHHLPHVDLARRLRCGA